MKCNSTSGWMRRSRTIKTFAAAATIFTVMATNPSAVEALDQQHDFESGKLSLTCSGNCPKLSSKYARRGKYAMESTISDSSSNKIRTEAVIPGNSKKMQFNRDYWIGFSVYLPGDWKVPNKMEMVAQIHQSQGSGSPPLALNTGSGEWKIQSRDAAGNSKEYLLNSIWEDVGRWTDWVIHYKPSTSSSGVLEIWKNGALVVKKLGANTYKGDTGPYFKMGIYKGKYSAPTKTVYHDELRIASGPTARYADVDPAFR